METLDYNTIEDVGVEVLFSWKEDAYTIILDPRLKLITNRGKIKASRLKQGDRVTTCDGSRILDVIRVYRRPHSRLFTFFKVQHKYPFVKKLCLPECKAYSKGELKTILLNSGYRFAMSMYDGLSLETQYPGYCQYLPGSVLAEDEDRAIDTEKDLTSFVEF